MDGRYPNVADDKKSPHHAGFFCRFASKNRLFFMGKTRSSACLLLPGYPVGGVRQAYDQPVGIPAGRLCGKLPTCGASDAAYLRASLASMHSVAWGTFISRSFGMSFPVVLQMPYVLFSIRTSAISRLRMNFI